MRNAPTNTDDVIDSRDVIERIEELREERLSSSFPSRADCENPDHSLGWWEDEYPDEAEELAALEALAEECEGYPDWKYGEALIRESYWVEYVEQLCKDIGDIPDNVAYYIVVDWDKTAENIAQDYSIVTFDGVDYYIRNC